MAEPLARESAHGRAVPGFVDTVQDLLARVLPGLPGIGPGDAMPFELAVVEVVGNAVRHSAAAGNEEVELDFEIEARLALLMARLYEIGADPFELPADGSQMPPLDEEAGRDLAMAKQLLTAISCERHEESNLWILTRHT
jgi:serine/threonine-protein kinase RsbW